MSLFSRHNEILEFARGTSRWRYALGDRPMSVEGQIYYAAPGLKRGKIMQSAEEDKAGLEITAPVSLGVLDQWKPHALTERVTVLLRRVRKSDGAVLYGWAGVVASVEDDTHSAQIRCITHMAAMAANGLHRPWSVACPLVLYGAGLGQCNASQDAFRVDATLSSVVGVTIASAAFAAKPDGYYNGGFVRWAANGLTEHRFIVKHVGDTLTLLTPSGLQAGAAGISVFPGCDHSLTTCNAKFDNAVNYGGQHTLPKKNPYGSDPIF